MKTAGYANREQRKVDSMNDISDEVYKGTGIRRYKLKKKYQYEINYWYEMMRNRK